LAGVEVATADVLADEVGGDRFLFAVRLAVPGKRRRLITDLSAEPEKKETGAAQDDRIDVPGMALEPHEHYDFVVVLATTTHEWSVLCDRGDRKTLAWTGPAFASRRWSAAATIPTRCRRRSA